MGGESVLPHGAPHLSSPWAPVYQGARPLAHWPQGVQVKVSQGVRLLPWCWWPGTCCAAPGSRWGPRQVGPASCDLSPAGEQHWRTPPSSLAQPLLGSQPRSFFFQRGKLRQLTPRRGLSQEPSPPGVVETRVQPRVHPSLPPARSPGAGPGTGQSEPLESSAGAWCLGKGRLQK